VSCSFARIYTPRTEIYTLSLHDALPICHSGVAQVIDIPVQCQQGVTSSLLAYCVAFTIEFAGFTEHTLLATNDHGAGEAHHPIHRTFCLRQPGVGQGDARTAALQRA